jgi:hypothetical protein
MDGILTDMTEIGRLRGNNPRRTGVIMVFCTQCEPFCVVTIAMMTAGDHPG